jgi:hypothetical protein
MIQDIKQTPLNYPLSEVELSNQCKAIIGGVSWPSKRPGFAVVVAMLYEKHFDSHDIYLLEEYEDYDIGEIVRRCAAMDERYKPAAWFGDNRNQAADRLMKEMDEELQHPINYGLSSRSFCVSRTVMVEIEMLYPYILPKLKRLLQPERRMLFLKESKIVNHMQAIDESEIAELRAGEYPAVEALAFAVIELKRQFPDEKPIIITLDGSDKPDDANSTAMSYATKTAFD